MKSEHDIIQLLINLMAITSPYNENRKELKEKLPKIFSNINPEEYDIIVLALAWVMGFTDYQ